MSHGGHNRHDLTGQRFGLLTVNQPGPNTKHGRARWYCVCDCGTVRLVIATDLVRGHTKSCGCGRRDALTRHGQHRSAEYQAWRAINQRCGNPKNPSYPNYGARGIRVTFASFEQFRDGLGPRPSAHHSIDRFPDNNGHYAPGNVRWATAAEQQRNRRDNVVVELNGKLMVAADAAAALGWRRGSLAKRLASGNVPFRVVGRLGELPESVRAELGERP